jgi:DNA-binding IclR family transcriptional regulator
VRAGIVGSAARVLQVLDAVSDATSPASVRDIALWTGIPRSTVHRLAQTLVAWGGLKRESGGYVAGMHLFELGIRAPDQRRLRELALPELARLHADTGAVVQVSILDGAEVLCVERVKHDSQRDTACRPGGRLPAHASAAGKLLLTRRAPLDRPPGALAALTASTITDHRTLAGELARIRRAGVAFNDQESQPGYHSAAVAVLERNDVVAALAIARTGATGPAFVRHAVPRLRIAAQRVSNALNLDRDRQLS